MKKLPHLLLFLPVLAVMSGCQAEQQEEGPGEMVAASAVVEIPVTSATDAAMADFKAGLHAMDVGRTQDANELFEAAAENDPSFGSAYLYIANTAASWQEYKTAMELAAADLEGMSDGEKLLVDINMTAFNNDADRQLQLSEQLVQEYPSSPRAWLNLGSVLSGLNRHEEARTAMVKAVELDPTFVAAHSAIGISYIFGEPKDYKAAEVHLQHAIDLEPEEARPYIDMGDLHRARQDLVGARDLYMKAAQVDPTSEVAFSKAGHADSYLGNFDQARSDFDRASELAESGSKAAWMSFRAFVNLYAGDPQAAVEELAVLLESIDVGMGIPEEEILGAKSLVVTNIATIALHEGMLDVAAEAIEQRNALLRAGAEIVGTEDFSRAREANIAFFEGLLAVAAGDFETARAKAEENARLVEPENNPRKMEAYHNLMGWTALAEGDYQAAVEQYRQANLNNIYVKYHLALALEGAGNEEEAIRFFTEVAEWNFNSVGYGLVRNAAIEKLERAAV